jgi:hypothetical protein
VARVPKRDRAGGDTPLEDTINQAQYMIRIYAEIVAMDETIIERVRLLVGGQPDNGDRKRYLSNLRLLLLQMVKVGERIDYWNARLRKLVEEQLS